MWPMFYWQPSSTTICTEKDYIIIFEENNITRRMTQHTENNHERVSARVMLGVWRGVSRFTTMLLSVFDCRTIHFPAQYLRTSYRTFTRQTYSFRSLFVSERLMRVLTCADLTWVRLSPDSFLQFHTNYATCTVFYACSLSFSTNPPY